MFGMAESMMEAGASEEEIMTALMGEMVKAGVPEEKAGEKLMAMKKEFMTAKAAEMGMTYEEYCAMKKQMMEEKAAAEKAAAEAEEAMKQQMFGMAESMMEAGASEEEIMTALMG